MSDKKIIYKNFTKLPPKINVELSPLKGNWEEFEYWVQEESILCTKVGKVVVIKCLTAILADIADDDPELQMLALESLEDIMRLYVLGGCEERDSSEDDNEEDDDE